MKARMVSSKAKTVSEYLKSLPPERRQAVSRVRDVILKHLPKGYEEMMLYGMICYVVPESILPAKDTYNGQLLTYAGLAAQKNYCSLYVMNVYGDKTTEKWFREGFKKAGKKLDMGKACVRFQTADDLPLTLIGQTVAKNGPNQYAAWFFKTQEAARARRAKKRGRS